MKKSWSEFTCLPSLFALFLAPVLHEEFVGAKSDKLLGDRNRACTGPLHVVPEWRRVSGEHQDLERFPGLPLFGAWP